MRALYFAQAGWKKTVWRRDIRRFRSQRIGHAAGAEDWHGTANRDGWYGAGAERGHAFRVRAAIRAAAFTDADTGITLTRNRPAMKLPRRAFLDPVREHRTMMAV
jgi:hypothetical protein